MSSDEICVCVRVRPFNAREKLEGAKCIISMPSEGEGSVRKVLMKQPDGEDREFDVSHAFWSHDGFDKEEFVTNEKVFQAVGSMFLDNAFQMFNSTVMAYGQTGSGKSYSMMGKPEDPGVIPQGCKELFVRLDKLKEDNPKAVYDVEVSFFEIYNEMVKDILRPSKISNKRGLRIRESKKEGPYVSGLAKIDVDSYKDIEKWIAIGNKNRTIAATKMNQSSSRGHSIFTIYLNSKVSENGSTKLNSSKINLVDLAGSERQKKTHATGERLKEANAINQSLSALGNVISALANKQDFVPYRSSVLTRLLTESLGGNAKTIMLMAISPSHTNLDSTLSTLRYSQRLRSISNKPKQNEADLDMSVKEAVAMIKSLKRQLKKASSEGSDPALQESLARDVAEKQKDVERMQKSNEELLKKMHTIQSERLHALQDSGISLLELGESFDIDKNCPHLINLSPDPNLSEALVYFLRGESTKLGTKSTIRIRSSGNTILDEHCVITQKDEEVTIEPLQSEGKVFVNGKEIEVGCHQKLQNCDRVVLGRSHLFRFQNPNDTNPRDDTAQPSIIDFDFVMREMEQNKKEVLDVKKQLQQEQEEAASKDVLINRLKRELSAREKASHQKIKVLEARIRTVLQNENADDNERADLEEELQQRQSEKVQIKTQLKDAEEKADDPEFHLALQEGLEHRRNQLLLKLEGVSNMVARANELAEDLGKSVGYSTVLKKYFSVERGQVQTEVLIRATYRNQRLPISNFFNRFEFAEELALLEAYYAKEVQTADDDIDCQDDADVNAEEYQLGEGDGENEDDDEGDEATKASTGPNAGVPLTLADPFMPAGTRHLVGTATISLKNLHTLFNGHIPLMSGGSIQVGTMLIQLDGTEMATRSKLKIRVLNVVTDHEFLGITCKYLLIGRNLVETTNISRMKGHKHEIGHQKQFQLPPLDAEDLENIRKLAFEIDCYADTGTGEEEILTSLDPELYLKKKEEEELNSPDPEIRLDAIVRKIEKINVRIAKTHRELVNLREDRSKWEAQRDEMQHKITEAPKSSTCTIL